MLCVSKLCVRKLCGDKKLCVSKLCGTSCVWVSCVWTCCVWTSCAWLSYVFTSCVWVSCVWASCVVSKLCVDKLCVSKLCGDKVYVRNGGGRAGGQAGAGRRKCTTKNKNPTQRCGKKTGFQQNSDVYQQLNRAKLPISGQTWSTPACGLSQRSHSIPIKAFIICFMDIDYTYSHHIPLLLLVDIPMVNVVWGSNTPYLHPILYLAGQPQILKYWWCVY